MIGKQEPHRSFMTYTIPHSGVMLCPCSYLWSIACAYCSTCMVHHKIFRMKLRIFVFATRDPLVQLGGEEVPSVMVQWAL